MKTVTAWVLLGLAFTIGIVIPVIRHGRATVVSGSAVSQTWTINLPWWQGLIAGMLVIVGLVLFITRRAPR